MSKPEASILISSYNRTKLLRRTLFSIAARGPSVPYEVVVADEGSTEDIEALLRTFSARFHWKLVRVDLGAFEQATGLKKFHNNPSLTNNVAFRHAEGDFIYLMGNEVIAWENCFDRLRFDAPVEKKFWQVFSTTYDVPEEHLEFLDDMGQNLSPAVVRDCQKWPLQSEDYRSDVTNYLSLTPRALWEKLGGYDERYLAGIACEDSDFVRRARAAHDYQHVLSRAVSLHQSHGGMTRYYSPKPDVIASGRWDEGVGVNRSVYEKWDGDCLNPQPWEWGKLGVVNVTTNRSRSWVSRS